MTYNSCIWLSVKADDFDEACRLVADLATDVEADSVVISAWPGDTEECGDE